MQRTLPVPPIYQLSLERPTGRFTDKEWQKELKTRQARNKQYAFSHYLKYGETK